MNSETTTQRERLQILESTGRAIGTASDLQDLGRIVRHGICRLVDVTGFILALYDERSQLVTVTYQNDSGKELPGGSFPLGHGITSEVIRTGSPLLIRHWSLEGPQAQIRYSTERGDLPESALVVPLRLGEQVLGCVSLQSYQPDAYDEEDLFAVEIVAGQLALAVRNLHLSRKIDTQLQLRVSELEAVLENMADGLLIVDAQGCIVRINRRARELLGAESNSLLFGRPLDREQWEQWPAESRAVGRALAPVVKALREGEALTDLETTVHSSLVLSLSCAPLHYHADNLAGGVIVFRDVTSRHDIERLKDEVLSIASHDLKSPLTVIKGQIQLLRRQYEQPEADPQRAARGWAMLERSCDQLVELMDLLLDFSRIEAGRLELHRTPTDLIEITQLVMEGIQTTTERHVLVLQAPPELVGNWDKQRIEQVLRNLITNAVKYSPEGGTIEVTIEAANHTTVSVKDEGIGLATEDVSRIFERFYRTGGTRKLVGAGLGLYICSQIVSAHGGRIWAESAGPGHGSTFRFTLP